MNISGKSATVILIVFIAIAAYVVNGRLNAPKEKTARKSTSARAKENIIQVTSLKHSKGVQKIPQPDGGQMILDNDWRVINTWVEVLKHPGVPSSIMVQDQLCAMKYSNDLRYEFTINRLWLQDAFGKVIKATEEDALGLMLEPFTNPAFHPEYYVKDEHCLPLTRYECNGRTFVYFRVLNKNQGRYMSDGMCLTDAGIYYFYLGYPVGTTPGDEDGLLSLFEKWTPGKQVKEIKPQKFVEEDGWDVLELPNGRTCEMPKKMLFIGYDEKPVVCKKEGDITWNKQVVYMGGGQTSDTSSPEWIVCVSAWKADAEGNQLVCSDSEWSEMGVFFNHIYSYKIRHRTPKKILAMGTRGTSSSCSENFYVIVSYHEDRENYWDNVMSRVYHIYIASQGDNH